MVILNFLIPILLALLSFIKPRKFKYIFISIISLGLLINNVFIMLHPQDFKLGEVLNYPIIFKSDPFANIFALMVSTLNLFTNLYSFSYIQMQEKSILEQDLKPKIHFFFTPLAILATLAVAYSANLITLFIFYEILTLVTYPLVIQPLSESAYKAGRIYFGMLFASSSILILFALIYIDMKHGILPFSLSGNLSADFSPKEILMLLICFVFGFSKTAIFPLYLWLPKAMVAPVPVSAILHAVAVVKTGILCLIKVFLYVFGLNLLKQTSNISSLSIDWIAYLSCFTILFASIMGLFQNSVKKILAYSTISNLSYMILGITLLSHKAIVVTFMKLLIHSVAKITLFFSTGIIYLSTYKVKLNELDGVSKLLPLTATLFILASFTVLGFPFTIGYTSLKELYILIPSNKSGIIFCLFAASLFAAAYFFKIIFHILNVESDETIQLIQKPRSIVYTTIATFMLSFLLYHFYSDIEHYLMDFLSHE